METTYHLTAKDITDDFVKSLKALIADQEVEMVVKSAKKTREPMSEKGKKSLRNFIQRNLESAPVISSDINIRDLIDETHNRPSI